MKRILALATVLLICACSYAFAQDEATTFDDSTVVFTAPVQLQGNTEYEFVFQVTNKAIITGEKKNWIKQVDLMMPSPNYTVNSEDITIPTPLHGDDFEGAQQIDHWDAMYNEAEATITWEAFGVVSSAEYGDIREGETLEFAFRAITDENGTDGFAWLLYGDEGENVSGTSYIQEYPESEGPVDEGGDDDTGCGCSMI